MALFDALKRRPRRLWTEEDIERHCEGWAQNWVDTWNSDWGRVVNKIADRTNLSFDNVLFAMAFVQSYGSAKKQDERNARSDIIREEELADHRAWVKLNERFEDVLIRVEKLLVNAETTNE